MSNRFGTSRAKPEHSFRVSNGGTDVLLAVLVLAGTALARTSQDVRLVVWLASQDQALMGRGVVGFDAAELPWEEATFAADKAFMISVIAAARRRVGWERLGYEPPPDRVEPNLDAFAAAIAALEPVDIDWVDPREPVVGWPEESRRCPVHEAYENVAGCLLCHADGPAREEGAPERRDDPPSRPPRTC